RRPLLPAGAHGNWRAGGLHDAHSAARSLSLHLARRRGWPDREGMALRTAWRRRPGPRRRPDAGLDRWGLGERVGGVERTNGGRSAILADGTRRAPFVLSIHRTLSLRRPTGLRSGPPTW